MQPTPRSPRPRPRRNSSAGALPHGSAAVRNTRSAPRSRPAPRRRPPSRRVQERRRQFAVGCLAILIVLFVAGVWWAYGFLRSGVPPAPEKPRSVPTQPAEDPVVRATRKAVKVPSYLGGPHRDLTGFGPPPERLDLIWKLPLGSGPTRRKVDNALTHWAGSGWTGQPTVLTDAGRTWLLLGAYDHALHRIDAASGRVEWESKWPDVMKGTNTIVPNPASNTGGERWIVVSGSRRGPDYSVGDSRIAPLRAVSFDTGKELWRLPIPKTDNYSQDVDSSPLWYKSVLYAPVEPGFVYALDPFTVVKKDGVRQPKILARSPRLYEDDDVAAHPDIGGANLAVEGSPAAIGNVIYITSGSGHIYGLDRRTLKIVWDFETGSDIDGTPSVTSDGKLLVTLEKQYVKQKGGAYLLDPTKDPADAVVWYYPTPTRGMGEWAGGSVGSVTTNEARNDGSKPRLAVLSTVDGKLRVVSIDRRTAERAKGPGASKKAPAPYEVLTEQIGPSISTPVFIGDRIVTAGYDRKVRLFQLDYEPAEETDDGALKSPDGRYWTVRSRLLDTFTAQGVIESTPLVYKGRVYIGSRDGNLYCLGG